MARTPVVSIRNRAGELSGQRTGFAFLLREIEQVSGENVCECESAWLGVFHVEIISQVLLIYLFLRLRLRES